MKKNIPHHLGVIIDGNRRWARKRGLPTLQGHKKGLERLKSLVRWAKERGVKILTVYIFSTENWDRSEKEVNYLMNLFRKVFEDSSQLAEDESVRVKIVGEEEMAPKDIRKKIKKIKKETKDNKEMTVNLAFSYGGRKEIVHAVKKIVKKGIKLENIDEKLISNNLYIPDNLDFIIRTGMEKRISNFLVWQLAYAEFYFLDKYWPAFTEKDLDEALEDYSNRQRRFGK